MAHRSTLPIVCLLAGLLASAPFTAAVATPPVSLIFDTDLGNDVDDAMALAMVHALEDRGECRLLAVTLTKDNIRDLSPTDAAWETSPMARSQPVRSCRSKTRNPYG